MVRKISQFFLIVCFIILSAQVAFAASFTASVDRRNVVVGESFVLELRLSDTSPKSPPDISSLEKVFSVRSQSHSSRVTIINNRTSSSVSWHVTLIPKSPGTLTIPALSVNSDAGTLKSQPIDIIAKKPLSVAKNSQNRAVFVDTKISKQTPYESEPVLLSVKLIASKNITNISLADFSVAHAITEQQGEAQVYEGVLQGRRVKIIEVRYLITPLQAGTMKIPALVFRGKMMSGKRQDSFGMFGGFTTYKPFAVAGEEVTLEVKAPAVQMDPWLPLSSLKISEEWDGEQTVKVGEPVTRKLIMIAEGVTGTALPNLEDQTPPNSSFKIYADKPATGEKIDADGKKITGWREESYTLIPQNPGTLTLPEIRVPWWDIKNERIAYAVVPTKTMDVKAGELQGQGAVTDAGKQAVSEGAEPKDKKEVPQPQTPKFLHDIIVVLGTSVIIMIGIIIYLFRRLSLYKRQEDTTFQKISPPANEDRISSAELKKVRTADDLCSFLQTYAHQYWDMPMNASLHSIAADLKKRDARTDITVLYDLDAALYADGKIDIEDLKQRSRDILGAINKKSAAPGKQHKKLGALNPS